MLETGSKEGRLLKSLVEVDLTKPLMRGTKIRLEEEYVWVNFKYEQLPQFYYYCGCIGRPERNCEKKLSDFRNDCISEGQYVKWLRVPVAKQVKRRDLGELRGRLSDERELARQGKVEERTGIKGCDKARGGVTREAYRSNGEGVSR